MIVSNEWLGESKLSPKVIHLDSPSTSIRCQIHKTSFDAFYNLVVGVNLMSKSFAHTLPRNMQLTPTNKLLKSLSRQILPSEGIFHFIPIKVDKTKVHLSFYVFDIWEFDLLIGHPIETSTSRKKGEYTCKSLEKPKPFYSHHSLVTC